MQYDQFQDVHGSHVLANLVLFLGGPKKVLYVQPYSLESHCPADFNSNPNQTHLFKVFRIIIKRVSKHVPGGPLSSRV